MIYVVMSLGVFHVSSWCFHFALRFSALVVQENINYFKIADTSCVMNCTDIDDGIYQSCHGCNFYVECKKDEAKPVKHCNQTAGCKLLTGEELEDCHLGKR